MAISKYRYARILIRRMLYKNSTSDPFLSSDSFRKLADISIRTERDFPRAIELMNENSVVFCTSEIVQSFMNLLGPTHYAKFLIAGDSDFDFTREISMATRHFHKIYLQNSLVSDSENIFTLPIGVENMRLGGEVGLPRNLRNKKLWLNRKKLVLNGPYSLSDKSRRTLLNFDCYSDNIFTNILEFVSPTKYASIVGQHRFVLCPRGNGKDTHRFWETLYRGAIPIVLNDKWSYSLKTYKIPFIGVDDFSPSSIIAAVDKALDCGIYDAFQPANVESLWLNYWAKIFQSKAQFS